MEVTHCNWDPIHGILYTHTYSKDRFRTNFDNILFSEKEIGWFEIPVKYFKAIEDIGCVYM